jgi:hypothetical protein
MKLPWKKNVNKLPREILEKLNTFGTESIKVSGSKEIKREDILDGKYAHIGILIEGENKLIFNKMILPKPGVGRFSNYNVNGRTILRRDLPKVDKSFSREMPVYGDWSRGSFTQTRNMKVFQREFWLPKELLLEIEVIDTLKEGYLFKFSIDRALVNTENEEFYQELLFFCNVLKENTGICDIYKAEASDLEYIKTLQVEWELLPPGTANLDSNIKYLLGKHRNPSQKLADVYADRIEFFDSLKPKQYITGNDKFNRYFGALLEDDMVILENSSYGNAIYIFFENWQELSKLSRVELLSSTNKDFERVTHYGKWKNRVTNVITNHR